MAAAGEAEVLSEAHTVRLAQIALRSVATAALFSVIDQIKPYLLVVQRLVADIALIARSPLHLRAHIRLAGLARLLLPNYVLVVLQQL